MGQGILAVVGGEKWVFVRDPGSKQELSYAAQRVGTSPGSLYMSVSLVDIHCSMLMVLFASLSCPLLQPPPSGPFTSSFGGAGFSDDPFKSKQDTPALPPKKPAPPRPKPPSGQYTFFSRRCLPAHCRRMAGD